MTRILCTPHLLRPTAAAISLLLASASSAWAQSATGVCEIALGYAAVAAPPVLAPTAVPGLTLLGVGILGGLVAAFAWRSRHKGGINRFMSVVLMTGAAVLSVAGGDSLVNVVRAAGPYEFSSSTGGTVADTQVAYADPAPVLTVTNTSGGRIKITSNGNSSETGTCTVNSEIAPGASCTTQAFACTPPPPVVQPIEVLRLPASDCNNNNVLGTYVGSYNTVTAYSPIVGTQPSFNIDNVAITTTFTRSATAPTYDSIGLVSNGNDLLSGTLSVTATAPAGYGFGASLANSFTWDLPYSCGTIAVRPRPPEP